MEANKKRDRRREYNRKWIKNKRQKREVSDESDLDQTSAHKEGSHKESGGGEELTHNMKLNHSEINSEVLDADHAEHANMQYIDGAGDDNDGNIALNRTFVNFEASSDSSGSDPESDFEDVLIEDLRIWANQNEIKGVAVTQLLKLLRKKFPDLPGSARTLLKTPRNVEITSVSGMEYFHFGLNSMLIHTLKKCPKDALDDVQTLELTLNIDGLPLFKSTNTSVWPVLCHIGNISSSQVFPVSIAVGISKPKNNDFLRDSISDLNKAFENGIEFEGKKFQVCLQSIVCDAPAKAMVKSIKLYSGYFGCDRCCQKGEYNGRVIYPQVTNLTVRTDATFRTHAQEQHHTGVSPLIQLNDFDMIDGFPVDYMHQVCLGVTKKLLHIWTMGPRERCRISASQSARLSNHLTSLRKYIPVEFARKPRGLKELPRWKATEFRQFLLYTGQFVLKEVLPEENYNHFMVLSVAISILVCPRLVRTHGTYADQLLQYFVSQGAALYGNEFLVYNVHSLVHLVRCAQRFGSLDKCAAWKFENFMQRLKRKVRNGTKPAAQIVRRTMEEQETVHAEERSTKSSKINCRRPHNAFLTNDKKYCEVLCENSSTSYRCRVYNSPEPIFTHPCSSLVLGMCKVVNTNYAMKILEQKSLAGRCIMMAHDDEVIFLPLLHDYYM